MYNDTGHQAHSAASTAYAVVPPAALRVLSVRPSVRPSVCPSTPRVRMDGS